MLEFLLIFFIVLLSACIQSAAGVGFAIVAVPLLKFIMPVKQATMVTLLLLFLLTVILAIKTAKYINLKICIPVIFASILVSTCSTSLLSTMGNELASRILGGFLIVMSIYLMFASKKIVLKPSLKTALIAGGISGFFGGLFSIEGPPLAMYYLLASKNKNEYNAFIQFSFCIAAGYRTLMNILMGNITKEILPAFFVGCAGLLIGGFAGKLLFSRLNSETIKTGVYIFMIIAGFFIIL